MTTTIESFRSSVSASAPPADAGPALQALWWLRKGDWSKAHEVCQGHEGDKDCDWVHAHLHREEGDLSNAGYWYRHAGKTMPDTTIEEEWRAITTAMLTQSSS
jgi:hypothetical protein